MSVEITWARNSFTAPSRLAGWRATVAGVRVGTVFADGSLVIKGAYVECGSPYLAAKALLRYVEETMAHIPYKPADISWEGPSGDAWIADGGTKD